jgi:hypothetical protein
MCLMENPEMKLSEWVKIVPASFRHDVRKILTERTNALRFELGELVVALRVMDGLMDAERGPAAAQCAVCKLENISVLQPCWSVGGSSPVWRCALHHQEAAMHKASTKLQDAMPEARHCECANCAAGGDRTHKHCQLRTDTGIKEGWYCDECYADWKNTP